MVSSGQTVSKIIATLAAWLLPGMMAYAQEVYTDSTFYIDDPTEDVVMEADDVISFAEDSVLKAEEIVGDTISMPLAKQKRAEAACSPSYMITFPTCPLPPSRRDSRIHLSAGSVMYNITHPRD